MPRRIEPTLLAAAGRFPAVILAGPRRSGKTTLLRRAFPRASYHLLEDRDLVGPVRADPRGFLVLEESPRVSLLHGGYPEVLARPSSARLWFASCVQTYLERDVRAVSAIRLLNDIPSRSALAASSVPGVRIDVADGSC